MRELSLNVMDVAQNSVRAEASLVTIIVSESDREDSLRISIGDNGCGMTEEQVQQVIDPFFTTRTTRKVGLGVPLFKLSAEQTGGTFDIQVSIYTISGKLVKTLYDTQFMDGNRCRAISWDGLDDFGDKLAKGTYLYRVRVKNQDGKTAEAIEKLVIL